MSETSAAEIRRTADRQRDRSARLLVEGRFDDAHTAVLEALDGYLDLEDVSAAGHALYVLGLVESSPGYLATGGGGAPASRFESAAQAFALENDLSMQGRSEVHLAGLDLREADAGGAIGHLFEAVGLFSDAGDHGRLLETVQLLVFALLLAGRVAESYEWAARGLELAEQLRDAGTTVDGPGADGDPDAGGDPGAGGGAGDGLATAALAFRLDLQHLARDPLLTSPVTPEPLAEVIADAQASGRADLTGYAQLTLSRQAVERGDLRDALRCAEQARTAALGGRDPVGYLLACIQTAGVHEAEGRDVDALQTLFTCGASLGDLLGEEARQPVLRLIEAVERRWGRVRFDAALQAHRARVGAD